MTLSDLDSPSSKGDSTADLEPVVAPSDYVPPSRRFERLIGISTLKTTLLVGAGLSYSLVELPIEIVKRLSKVQTDVETRLGLKIPCPPIDPDVSSELYRWAGDVYNQLILQGETQTAAKQKIAREIGVTTNGCWRAKSRVPLRGSTPRHRVIARLAREGRWGGVWSLNWDIWLESALCSVGIEPANDSSLGPLFPPTWITRYSSWTPTSGAPQEANQTLTIFKPHGCVEALINGGGAFILTNEELNLELSRQPRAVVACLKASLANKSFITLGWSAYEGYLRSLFVDLKADGVLHRENLTIIDPKPNNDGHKIVAECYGMTKEAAICAPCPPLVSTTDDLFLWLQARQGLVCMQSVFRPGDTEHAALVEWLNRLNEPVNPDAPHQWILGWFDDFLPVWVRFCFNSGRLKFRHGTELDANSIPTHRRDEHIPWNDVSAHRTDLMAATRLFLALSETPFPSKFNTTSFPGALWNNSTQHLIVPIPVWGDVGQVLSLAAIKPLASGYHWAEQGKIAKLSILPLHGENASIDLSHANDWKAEVASLMRVSYWATPSNINVVKLEDLKELA